MKNIDLDRLAVCEQWGASYLAVDTHENLGVSRNIRGAAFPLNGMRHYPTKGTTGWYIWAGDFSPDDDFFEPLHVEHIADWRPEIEKFLGLSPGWRFLITPDYEDIWFDPAILIV